MESPPFLILSSTPSQYGGFQKSFVIWGDPFQLKSPKFNSKIPSTNPKIPSPGSSNAASIQSSNCSHPVRDSAIIESKSTLNHSLQPCPVWWSLSLALLIEMITPERCNRVMSILAQVMIRILFSVLWASSLVRATQTRGGFFWVVHVRERRWCDASSVGRLVIFLTHKGYIANRKRMRKDEWLKLFSAFERGSEVETLV